MNSSEITVVIPTSPLKSHPSTAIIDRAVASVRAQLPNAPIILTADGLRPQHDARSAVYAAYKERVKDRWGNMLFFDYPHHVHQCEMLGLALPFVFTELMLYYEHDWALLDHIQWDILSQLTLDRQYNVIKFHADARIHPLHEHMMERRKIIAWGSSELVGLIETRQWSQNPHLASTEWYRAVWEKYLRDKTDFIENQLVGVVGNSPWEDHKVAIYNPVDYGMERIAHLDGREGEEF